MKCKDLLKPNDFMKRLFIVTVNHRYVSVNRYVLSNSYVFNQIVTFFDQIITFFIKSLRFYHIVTF